MINNELLTGFDPISLAELDTLSLMNRYDTKYVFHQRKLPELLKLVKGKYKLLEINGHRLMNYRTAYFDTPGLQLYLDHHNGKYNRYKIRFRDYIESHISFFEIKKKVNGNRTRKARIETPWDVKTITEKPLEFIAKHTPLVHLELSRTMDNNFQRLTFASHSTFERVTVDFGITYGFGGHKKCFDDIVVAEIKRGQGCGYSPMAIALKQLGVRPYGFSKYCIGIVSLYEGIKYNNFKPNILTINKLQNGNQ
jgi:hypothetical protein